MFLPERFSLEQTRSNPPSLFLFHLIQQQDI